MQDKTVEARHLHIKRLHISVLLTFLLHAVSYRAPIAPKIEDSNIIGNKESLREEAKMDQPDMQQNAMTREEALKHVAQLQAEVEEVRNRLVADEKRRVKLEFVGKSVEKIADQAGTVVGTSIAMARKLFKTRTRSA
jgi:hypothetical protein